MSPNRKEHQLSQKKETKNESSLSLLSLLDSGNYQTYNREVARALKSVNAAILLSELVNRYKYHLERKEIRTFDKHQGEWFYYTVEKCEERTCLSANEQKSAIKILESKGFFVKKAIGLPAKRHFKINISAITSFILDPNNFSSSMKIHELEEGNSTNSFNENPPANKEHNKEPLTKDPVEKKKETFFFSSQIDKFGDLEIPQDIRIRVCDEHPAKIDLLVKRIRIWENRDSDLKAMWAILKNWDTWNDSQTPEQREKENRDYLKALEKYDTTGRGAYKDGEVKVMVLSKCIEVGNNNKVDCVFINEKNFLQKVRELFKKYKLEVSF